jgi:small subunit ribosomal protein S6
MRTYEIMLILPAEADDAAVEAVGERIAKVLGAGGGQVAKTDKWGRRRFAHEMLKRNEGYYVILECQATPEAMKELDRVLHLADDVLRFKVVLKAA